MEAANTPGVWQDQHGNNLVLQHRCTLCTVLVYKPLCIQYSNKLVLSYPLSHYLLIHSGDPNSGCTSCTVHCTVFFTRLDCTQCQSLILSFVHVMCSSPICSVHFKCYNIFVSFKSFFSHIGFTSRPVIKMQKILLDTDTVRAMLLFCCCSFLLSPVASPFFASSGNFPAIVWGAPSFVLSQNMSHSDNAQTVMAVATSQVKLCPYDEEEPAT